MTRRWQDAPDPTEPATVAGAIAPRRVTQRPMTIAHPQAEFDLVVRRKDDGEYAVWLASSGLEVAVVGHGDTPVVALRDAHLQLTILVAMLAQELGR